MKRLLGLTTTILFVAVISANADMIIAGNGTTEIRFEYDMDAQVAGKTDNVYEDYFAVDYMDTYSYGVTYLSSGVDVRSIVYLDYGTAGDKISVQNTSTPIKNWNLATALTVYGSGITSNNFSISYIGDASGAPAPTSVPEPSTMIMLLSSIGIAGLASARKRK